MNISTARSINRTHSILGASQRYNYLNFLPPPLQIRLPLVLFYFQIYVGALWLLKCRHQNSSQTPSNILDQIKSKLNYSTQYKLTKTYLCLICFYNFFPQNSLKRYLGIYVFLWVRYSLFHKTLPRSSIQIRWNLMEWGVHKHMSHILTSM